MGILDKLLGRRGAELPLPRDSAGWGFLLAGAEIETQPIKTKEDALRRYSGWVYAAASTLAQDVRANPSALWQKKGARRKDWEAIADDKVPGILKRPNALQTWADLTELTVLHLDLTGEAYWHIMTTAGGKVVGLQVIYPHWIQEPIIENGRLARWRVAVPGWANEFISAEDLVPLFYPHPMYPLRGASPVEAFAVSHDMDTYARAYGAALLKNRARPDGIISTDQDLTREQADLIGEGWKDRYTRPGEVAVLGRGSKYQPVSVPLKDLEFMSLARLTRDQVLGIYKVPASKLGLIEDANRANGAEADQGYKENALLPRLRRIEDAINVRVLPRVMGAQEAARHYFEYENPVDEDQKHLLVKANTALQRGAITVNEYRQILELEPAMDGDVYLMPSSVTVMKSFSEAQPKAKPAKPAADPEEEPEPARAQRRVALNQDEAARKQTARQSKLERATLRLVRARFEAERDEVIARYRNDSTRGVHRRELADDLMAGMGENWAVLLQGVVAEAMREGWESLAEELGEEGSAWSIFEPRALEWAQRHVGEHVVLITDETREQLRDTISAAIASGAGIDETAEAIGGLYAGFNEGRSLTIARTETAQAMGRGKRDHAIEDARRFGWDMERTWHAAFAENTRPTHAAVHGQTVGLHTPYTVGGHSLAHPCDPNGPAKEVVNCRCIELYRIKE